MLISLAGAATTSVTPSVPGGDGKSRPAPVGGSAAKPSLAFASKATMPFLPDVMSNLRAYRARPGTSFRRFFS